MLSKKRHQVVLTNAAMPARRSIRRKKVLFDPVDHGSRVDVQQPTYLMCRVNGFNFHLRMIDHGGQNSKPHFIPDQCRRIPTFSASKETGLYRSFF